MAQFPSQEGYEKFNAKAIQELGVTWVDESNFENLRSCMYDQRKDPAVDVAIVNMLKCTSELVNAIKDPPVADNFEV